MFVYCRIDSTDKESTLRTPTAQSNGREGPKRSKRKISSKLIFASPGDDLCSTKDFSLF